MPVFVPPFCHPIYAQISRGRIPPEKNYPPPSKGLVFGKPWSWERPHISRLTAENPWKSCSVTVFGNLRSDIIAHEGLRNTSARQLRKAMSLDDQRRPCRFTYLCVREPKKGGTSVSQTSPGFRRLPLSTSTSSADTLSTYRRPSPRAPFAHFGTLIPNRTFA